MTTTRVTMGEVRAHAGRVDDPDPELPERAKRRTYTARYKLEILAEYEGLGRRAVSGKGGAVAELLMDLEQDLPTRTTVVGMLRVMG